MHATIIRYRWRYYDEARRKFFTTSYHCRESQIRIEHPDAVQVEGSRQVLVVPDDIRTNSTGEIQRAAPD